MRARTLLSATLAAVASTLVASSAFAQAVPTQPGFAVNRFDPSERGSEWFVMDSLDLRGNGRFAIGVPADWSYRSLVLYGKDAAGNEVIRDSIVRNQVTVHPGLSVVLFDRLRLGLSVPVVAFGDGHTGWLGGRRYAPANGAALGDIRVGADFRLVGMAREEFTLALGVQGYIPTGDASREQYASDGQFRLQGRLQAAGEIGAFMYAAKVGFMGRWLNGSYNGAPLGSEVTFGASIGLRAGPLVIGPEIYGSTVVSSATTDVLGDTAVTDTGSGFFKTRATPVEGLLGAHLSLGDFRINAGIGAGITRGYGAPVVRGLFGLEWAPQIDAVVEPTDRDKDGILDADDACPDTVGVKTDDPKTNGCPPPDDKDGDGVADKDDACVDVPGMKTDDPKTNGCPADKDKDGIADNVDACVDVPGVKSDDPKKNGCPSDRDGDGIVDADDKCPDQPGEAKFNGCPNPDRDGDGIENDKDACPDEPGKADADAKKNGCPKAFIKDGNIKILDQVKFKTNSAEIQKAKDSDDVLQAVLQVLNSHPEIKKVKVEGHTDNKGNAKANKTLSSNRAKSVMNWLVKNGVSKDRLSFEGFGQEKPIDSNNTDEGRKNNRRVEFHIESDAK